MPTAYQYKLYSAVKAEDTVLVLMWLIKSQRSSHAARNVKSGLWDKAGTPVPFLLHVVFYLYKTVSNGPASFHFLLAAKIKFPPWEKKEEI